MRGNPLLRRRFRKRTPCKVALFSLSCQLCSARLAEPIRLRNAPMLTKNMIRSFAILAFCFGWSAAATTHCFGQLSPVNSEHTRFEVISSEFISPQPISPRAIASFRQIGEAAKRSVDQLDPDRINDVKDAQEYFVKSVDVLRSHLAEKASLESAKAWIDYLEVEPLLSGIDDEESATTLAKKAIRINQKATGTAPGLEVTAVRRVRRAANEYANALRFSRKDRMLTLLSKQLEKFADEWSEIDAIPLPEDLETLQLLLDLFERSGQDIDLVRQANAVFSQPNIRVIVGDDLVQRSINRQVSQCSPVRDCILGTRIVGDALLSGNVTASLLPSIGTVRLQVALNGNVTSSNTGYNGPVRLKTSSYSQVQATRILSVDESGLRMEPVVVNASLNTRIDRIDHRLRLVRRIARKKAAEQKGQADAIAKGRLIDRVADGFIKDTDKAASKPMPDFMKDVRPILQRLNFREPSRTIGSTSNTVYLTAMVRQGVQLAAPVTAPPVPGGYEATMQIHESVVNNTIGTLLAGRTMKQSELESLAAKSGRAQSESTSSDSEDARDEKKEEFEIDFDRNRPIIFEARDGRIRIGIRGTRFAQGKRELKKKLEIVATYRPIKTMDGVVLLDREGDAEINFPGTKRLSTTQAGIRGSIKKGFAKAFPQILMDKPWAVPASVQAPAIQGRVYRPRYFDAQDGWLTLSVN